MNKAVPVVLLLAVGSAVLGLRCVGSYQALNACTEFTNRIDEAGRAPGSMSPTTEDSARAGVDKLAEELQVTVDSVDVSFENLTKDNASTVSSVVGQAVAAASKLPNHEIKGKIVQFDIHAHVKRRLTNRECTVNRRILLPGQ